MGGNCGRESLDTSFIGHFKFCDWTRVEAARAGALITYDGRGSLLELFRFSQLLLNCLVCYLCAPQFVDRQYSYQKSVQACNSNEIISII